MGGSVRGLTDRKSLSSPFLGFEAKLRPAFYRRNARQIAEGDRAFNVDAAEHGLTLEIPHSQFSLSSNESSDAFLTLPVQLFFPTQILVCPRLLAAVRETAVPPA